MGILLDRWMDTGQTDGKTDKWMDRQTNGQIGISSIYVTAINGLFVYSLNRPHPTPLYILFKVTGLLIGQVLHTVTHVPTRM